MCGLRVGVANSQGSYLGIVIGRIWGGEAHGQVPVHEKRKQSMRGWAGMLGVGLFPS